MFEFTMTPPPSPWLGTDDQRVAYGSHSPTHYTYVIGPVGANGMRRQWLVVGFSPTAVFRDGKVITLTEIPKGSYVKGLVAPLAIRAPARMVYKYLPA